ncbi:sugar phosphate nucleotidyltransferase [Aquibacillus kalidii]|uniref:sugar phosphate nucleotidyltransferase n=1 Tax=Aquibacillus kalidii TaxID=2762597 RepID=UPI0016453731|nr:sugar phosphate nucleotidyltransferase [Aquibacillus kalidii]
MRLILLSGGSGKRLWPLSNDARSKQFLKILEDENQNRISMVQRVWAQLDKVQLAESTVIATSNSQVDIVKNQLGEDVPLVIEPERRDTFPAIALACSYLYSELDVREDEVISILPVDPYVEDRFFERIKDLEKVIHTSIADLALMGVTPTYPSAKYGYIVPESNTKEGYLNVARFKEKPDEVTAAELIKENALWNCGIFAFKLSFILNLLKRKNFPTSYDSLIELYDQLPKNSFDFEVVESTEKIVAIDYQGYWKDLGTWNTLTEEMSSNVIGKAIINEESVDNHVINELDIPVAVLGINHVVVAVSPDGILVSDKTYSQRIKQYVNKLENIIPKYEETQWGSYKILDHANHNNGIEVITKKLTIDSGKNLNYSYNKRRSKNWTIVKGTGEIIVNGVKQGINPGQVVEITKRTKHTIRAINELEIIEIQTGTDLVENDEVVLNKNWDSINSTL